MAPAHFGFRTESKRPTVIYVGALVTATEQTVRFFNFLQSLLGQCLHSVLFRPLLGQCLHCPLPAFIRAVGLHCPLPAFIEALVAPLGLKLIFFQMV